MVDKENWLRLCNELEDRILQKEDIIERMSYYIARCAKKTKAVCRNNKSSKCNVKNCVKCVREYFEKEVQ